MRKCPCLEVVRAAVLREWGGDAEVGVFGSSASGTTLPASDIDIAVNGPYWTVAGDGGGGEGGGGEGNRGGGGGGGEGGGGGGATATASTAAAAAAAAAAAEAAKELKPKMARGARRLGDRLRTMVGRCKLNPGWPRVVSVIETTVR